MTRVAMSGAGGFLGWHTRAALRETGVEVNSLRVGDSFDLAQATAAIEGTSRAVHIAGVNRASDEDVLVGNLVFAEQFASAVRAATTPPPIIVYANSTQVGNGSVYGQAKERAAETLIKAAADVGAVFIDVCLPNLFGEHGRPFYNSVSATFSHLLAKGAEPTIDHDKQLVLLHAQNAADVLTGVAHLDSMKGLEQVETVSGLLGRLRGLAETYRAGEIPSIAERFDRELFNTYRSFLFPEHAPIRLSRHADVRGSFFEIVRSHGGAGQSSFSTTVPGVTRGDHFHRRKIERFTVLQGRARISLRRLFCDEVISFDVSGDAPVAIDMPTMWSHSITNVGDEILYTSFWTNDIFDPENPDTIAEAVIA